MRQLDSRDGLPTRLAAVTLYTRANCCLCDRAKELLMQLMAEEPFALTTIDIDTDPALKAEYDWDVPVIFVDGRKHAKHHLDAARFLRRLRAPAGAEEHA